MCCVSGSTMPWVSGMFCAPSFRQLEKVMLAKLVSKPMTANVVKGSCNVVKGSCNVVKGSCVRLLGKLCFEFSASRVDGTVFISFVMCFLFCVVHFFVRGNVNILCIAP